MEIDASEEALVREVQSFILEHRADCLWYLREDFVPTDRIQMEKLLRKIEARSDRATFIKARRLRTCLSRISSAGSAGS
jgi:hypothetical protein